MKTEPATQKPPLRKRIVKRLFGETTEPIFPPPPGSKSRLEEEALVKNNPFLQKALEEEKLYGQRLSFYSRTIALFVVGILLVFVNPRLEVLYYHAFLLLFVLIGYFQLRVAQVGQSRLELFLLQLDFVLLAAVLLIPNPVSNDTWPTAFQFRLEPFVFFFLLLAAASLAYSWRTIMAVGLWVSIIWLGSAALVALFGTKVDGLTNSIRELLGDNARMFEFLDPNAIHWGLRIQELVVFVLVTFILGLKTWRSNRLLFKQAEIAVERANLARYFPQSIADDLATRDNALGETRSQEVAVLFADVVGFTAMAEREPPETVVETLRGLHSILETCIFDHGGTLDKYLGDGVMATFGTPQSSNQDALNALECLFAMQATIETWNTQRRKDRKEPIQLSVGIHYGPVILGDIGTNRRLEYAALCDVVNVASRLEGMTRNLSCRGIVSEQIINRIKEDAKNTSGKEPSVDTSLLDRLEAGGEVPLKGRDRKVAIWLVK